ncbi:hypothetical protein FOL47_006757, partial [Perkinsus chesapeaki]
MIAVCKTALLSVLVASCRGSELQHICPPGRCLHYPTTGSAECVPVVSLITDEQAQGIVPALPLPESPRDQRLLRLSGMHSIECLPSELGQQGAVSNDNSNDDETPREGPAHSPKSSWLPSPMFILISAVVAYIAYTHFTKPSTAGRPPVASTTAPSPSGSDVVHHEPPKERLAYLDRLEADASRIKASPEWKEKERQREEDQRYLRKMLRPVIS